MKQMSMVFIKLILLLPVIVSAQSDKDSLEVDDRVFTAVDAEAEFPGGQAAWRNFLVKNLNVDIPVENDAPSGLYTVNARFIVRKDGTLDNIKLENKVGYGIDEEVIRVISKSGNWTPGTRDGRLVNAYRRQPISFLVESEAFEINTATPYTLFTKADNEITVKAEKVKAHDIELTISKGSIKHIEGGTYIVTVDKPGRVIIDVYNTKKKKLIGKAGFEVKEKK